MTDEIVSPDNYPYPNWGVYKQFIESYKRRPDFSYGLSKIDKYTNGFHKKEVVVIGGRPGEGKTTLSVQLAWTLAKRGKKVTYFSNEMPRASLWAKILSRETMIPQSRILSDEIGDTERGVIRGFFDNNLVTQKLAVYDQGEGLYPLKITNALRKEMPDVFIIDHLQMTKTDKQYQKRHEAIEEFIYQMKDVANKTDTTAILVSQCNRNVEGRKNYLPFLSDLKGSGAIEEVADLVFLLAWPWKVVAPRDIENARDENERRKLDKEKELYSMEKYWIEIAKNRFGAVANIPLIYDPAHCSYTEVEDMNGSRQTDTVQEERWEG